MQLDNSAVYHESVVDMVDIGNELPELVRHGRGDVAESVVLNVDFDDRLVDRITKQQGQRRRNSLLRLRSVLVG